MTIIKIFKKNGKYTGIIASGHTGFDEHGKDILCASISSIIQTAGLGLKKIVSDKITLSVNENIPEFRIKLPNELSNEQYSKAEIILKTCIIGLEDLLDGYHKFIKMEVKNDVY